MGKAHFHKAAAAHAACASQAGPAFSRSPSRLSRTLACSHTAARSQFNGLQVVDIPTYLVNM